MRPIEHFKFCPNCGASRTESPEAPVFHCGQCGFHYYFNPAVAAAAFVFDGAGRVLFIRRAKDPAKGKLAIPGGFVDMGETAEDALRREICEEVNLEIESIEYLCSQPNEYPYQGVTYQVLDFFFVAKAKGIDTVAALDGVESFCWLAPARVDLEEIAFRSMREALRVLRDRRGGFENG